MWTEKSPSDQPQRVFFTSLITGQRLEGGSQKRPREVLVRLKVDGQPFDGRKVSKNKETDKSGTVTKERYPSFQATLDCDKLVQNLFENKTKNMQIVDNILPPKIECIPDSCGTIHVICVSEGRIKNSSVTPLLNRVAVNKNCTVCWKSTDLDEEVEPCRECGVLAHPSCCLDPGQMKDAVFIDGILTKKWTCAMCCQSCGDSSRHESIAKKSRRKSKLPSRFEDSELAESIPSQRTDNLQYDHEIPCSICQLRGGPMSPLCQNDKTSWVHEVCRIWTSGINETQGITNERSMGKRQCSLCGGHNGKVTPGMKRGRNMMELPDNTFFGCVVKCAAVGCQLRVHPMCAVVSSLTSELHTAETARNNPMLQQIENESDIDRVRKEDVDLCSQYTLTFASINGTTNSYGKDPGIQRKAMLPILFCGIHNPKRDDSFYGLYPGGEHLEDGALVIPRCLECETVPQS
jgi:hypothetical protein